MDRVDERIIQIISYYCEYEDIISFHCCNSILYSRRDSVILKPLIKRRIVELYNTFIDMTKPCKSKVFIPTISELYLENIDFDKLKEIYRFLNNYDIDDIRLELREITDRYYEELVIDSVSIDPVMRYMHYTNQILIKERDFILNSIREVSENLFEDLITSGIYYFDADKFKGFDIFKNISYLIELDCFHLFKAYLDKFPNFFSQSNSLYSYILMGCYKKEHINRIEYLICDLKYPFDTEQNSIFRYIERLYEKLEEFDITKERVDELHRCARELSTI